MFRRKDEEGSDSMDATNDNATQTSTPAAASTPTPAPASATAATPAAAAAPAIAVASAPSQPAAFRPVPPAAAMAAANRPTPPVAPAAPAAPVASAPASLAAAERLPSAPVARPQSKRVLTVGPEIQMKGEVTSCDRVIIEGTVDATMRDVHTVELTESGSLKGTAEVEDAEISGVFEGELTVRGRLTVYASGRVRGNVTYGEIEIQRGGQISGNIRNANDAKSGAQQPKKAA